MNNNLLLKLNIKHFGVWKDVYDELEGNEDSKKAVVLSEHEINSIFSSIPESIKYISMLDNSYPTNYKSIYKPPFGIFVKGDYQLIEKDNAVNCSKTVIGNVSQILNINKQYSGKLLWVNLTPSQFAQVLKARPEGNIFYFEQVDKMFPSEVPAGNVCISEIYQKNNNMDYSFQPQERIIAGLTKTVDIASKTSKQISKLYLDYSKVEDIKINNL